MQNKESYPPIYYNNSLYIPHTGGGGATICHSPIPPYHPVPCAEVMNLAAQLGILIVYTEIIEMTDL